MYCFVGFIKFEGLISAVILQKIQRKELSVMQEINGKRFVRYKEGAEMYSISQSLFEILAKQAGAIYKIGRAVLVNCEIFEAYLETFRIQP